MSDSCLWFILLFIPRRVLAPEHIRQDLVLIPLHDVDLAAVRPAAAINLHCASGPNRWPEPIGCIDLRLHFDDAEGEAKFGNQRRTRPTAAVFGIVLLRLRGADILLPRLDDKTPLLNKSRTLLLVQLVLHVPYSWTFFISIILEVPPFEILEALVYDELKTAKAFNRPCELSDPESHGTWLADHIPTLVSKHRIAEKPDTAPRRPIPFLITLRIQMPLLCFSRSDIAHDEEAISVGLEAPTLIIVVLR
mmetsp:Transcript_24642/g.82500  ORF Transcript_24642/g.82500 Transcript_24642/m.82500 type:complete len:249 (-) Transcript_24642:372-1118(-)